MKKKIQLLILLLILGALVAGCSGKNSDIDNAVASGVSATQTKEAWEAEMESARETELAQAANINTGTGNSP